MHLTDAIVLAAKAHEGQVDKQGVAYILHPLRVMLAATESDRVVAVLHDVIEDTSMTLNDLRHDLTAEELAALDALSCREGETHSDYIERVCLNEKATRIKYLDTQDNMRAGCPAGLLKRNKKTLQRLLEAWVKHVGKAVEAG